MILIPLSGIPPVLHPRPKEGGREDADTQPMGGPGHGNPQVDPENQHPSQATDAVRLRVRLAGEAIPPDGHERTDRRTPLPRKGMLVAGPETALH